MGSEMCIRDSPDGGTATLTPGMMATITGGSFYQLHNRGEEPLIMIGTRSGAVENTVKVEHGTGRIINERINYSS